MSVRAVYVKNRHGIIIMLSICQNAQLTCYNCQSSVRKGMDMESSSRSVTNMPKYVHNSPTMNEHEIISMITISNMPECTTHTL